MIAASRAVLLVAVLLPVASVSSLAADPPPNWTKPPVPESTTPTQALPQASIPFARQHGIMDWAIADDKTVYVEGGNFQWYKADLMFHCIGLPFAFDRLAFTFEPTGAFDKFSEIRFHDQHCPLVSLTMVDPPPGHKGRRAQPKTASASGPASTAAPQTTTVKP